MYEEKMAEETQEEVAGFDVAESQDEVTEPQQTAEEEEEEKKEADKDDEVPAPGGPGI